MLRHASGSIFAGALSRGSAASPPTIPLYHRPFLDEVQSPAAVWPSMISRVLMLTVASNSRYREWKCGGEWL